MFSNHKLIIYGTVNMSGEIIAVKITKGNIDDRKGFEAMVMAKNL